MMESTCYGYWGIERHLTIHLEEPKKENFDLFKANHCFDLIPGTLFNSFKCIKQLNQLAKGLIRLLETIFFSCSDHQYKLPNIIAIKLFISYQEFCLVFVKYSL